MNHKGSEINMKILTYPNDILLKPCDPITNFDESLSNTIKEMSETMLANKGVGLAANQVGLSIQLFIIKLENGQIVEFINPKLVSEEGMILMSEGCLSTPGIFLQIARPEYVILEYSTKTGERKQSYFQGIEARAVQHEMEHLRGEFYLDKVNRQLRRKVLSKLK